MSWDLLILPFEFRFMLDAFLLGTIIAIPAALLSCFLVVKGWALIGDAVSHAVLPGIVLAYLIGVPLIIGAFLSGMCCVLASGYISAHSRIKPDTVMGVVFSSMFGLGLVLYGVAGGGLHLEHILFGNLLGVEQQDILLSLGVAILVTSGVMMKWKDLLAHSFDASHAHSTGLPVKPLYFGLLAGLSLTIISTLSATGLILAIGLMIAPGAIARLLVSRFSTMLIISSLLSLGVMFSGIYLSFFIDSAPAPTIILIFSIAFLIAFYIHSIRSRIRNEG